VSRAKFLRHGQGVGATIRLADAEGDNPYIVTGILGRSARNSDSTSTSSVC